MQLIRGQHNIQKQHRGGVITIGNFDGLHLGHQALLKLLKDTAAVHHTHSCLMTFEPLPHEFFAHQKSPARLMNLREKWTCLNHELSEVRPDLLLVMEFNHALAGMSARAFVSEILVDRLAIQALVIGDDFRFGCDREGDTDLLQAMGAEHGFSVKSLSTHAIDDLRVSSTRVREALESGLMQQAQQMLGRPYLICGRIVHGDKRGRSIGFPTANIRLNRPVSSLSGVYSVTMHTENHGDAPGIANVGHRPTVGGENIQLEVHLFDFDADLYGQHVCVSFQHKIREEQKFDSFEDLKRQIELDCEQARKQLITNS